MQRQAGLLGAPPTYRRGLQASLADHGWAVHLLEDTHTAVPTTDLDVVIVLDDPGDIERTRTAAEEHDTVITLLPDPIAEDHVACVRAGATAVADANGEPETIAAALDAVATAQVLVPATTFQRLVAIARSHGDDVQLAQSEIDWMRKLAAGDPVRDLAKTGSWSDRAMHRALAALYRRIGVTNRDQAVAWAARHGLLDDTTPQR